MDEELGDLIRNLSETTGDKIPIELIDGTYEIEADNFTLTFTTDEEVFEIRNIDVRDSVGLGRQIINAIHDYADNSDLEVLASNVLGTARGFWETMGYQEGETQNEYFRVT